MNQATRDTRHTGKTPRGRIRVAVLVAVALLTTLSPPADADIHLDSGFTPNPRPHSVVIDWVEVMLMAIEQNPPAPTATTWRMWVVTSSMYDAWSAYDPTALATHGPVHLKAAADEHPAGSAETAVSFAAHRALVYVFPEQREMFDAVLASVGLAPDDSLDVTTPAGLGNSVAEAVIEARLADGSNAASGFAQVTSDVYPELYSPVNSAEPSASNAIGGPDHEPNRWTPLRVPTGVVVDGEGNPVVDPDDPASFVDQTFLTPHWGAVNPFALTSGDQFRPPSPPLLGSDAPYTDALGVTTSNDAAFRAQADAILEANAELTDEHKVIAEFWADGPHTWTPPGHWVQIAIGVSLRDGNSVAEDVELFMALCGALLDAGIASWDAKRAYDFVRPASAIPVLHEGELVYAWGGPNKGRVLIDGADWQPYQSATFVTPPFAEYVSGHSTFSAAAAEIVTEVSGTDRFYDGVTRLGRDYDGDGEEDLLGRHVALPGSLEFEDGPAGPVLLTWDTFGAAADEAGISRLYGGIHFQDGDLRGRELGAQIAALASDRARLHVQPFGELRRTVRELGDAGELSRRRVLALSPLLKGSEILFEHGRPRPACALLDSAARLLNVGRGATPEARALLSGLLAEVEAGLCR